MKHIQLNLDYCTTVDDEDYETLKEFKWFIHTDDTRQTCYAIRNLTRKTDNCVRGTRKIHRQIMGVSDPEIHVDHIDGNGLNNQRSNLQLVNRSQNQLKRKRNFNNTSGVKGVTKRGAGWRSYININGVRVNLYSGPSKEVAIKARLDFEKNNGIPLQNIPSGDKE